MSSSTNRHHTNGPPPTASAALSARTAGRARPSFSPDSRFSEWRTSRGTRGLVTTLEDRTGSVGDSSAPSRSDSVHDRLVSVCAATATTAAVIGIEMLQSHWHLPLRKLVLAMPITAAVVAVAAHTLTSLSWTESLLLGALLSPTDPVLSSSVVTNPRVPRLVRHSLNLESGLNDGLALPAVLALSAALAVGGGPFVWWRFVLEDIGFGFAAGLLVGFTAARVMPVGRGLETSVPDHQKSLYALGSALTAYGLAVLAPHGNGLIAVYVAAITLGIRRPDLRAQFARQAADLVELVKLGIFAVFGSVLSVHALLGDGWAAVAVVAVALLVARPAAVAVALARTATDLATRGFMAWFGPKGVATMTFSLLVLSKNVRAGARIFDLAALAVVSSVILHGLSDVPGSEWLARRSERESA